MIILTAIVGSLFRRWWGGWLSPNSTIKRIIGFVISILTAYFTIGLSLAILSITAILMFCWMMPNHGYGMSMGLRLNEEVEVVGSIKATKSLNVVQTIKSSWMM